MRSLCVTYQLGQVIQRLGCARWIARSLAAIEDVCARATLFGSPVGSLEVEVVNAVCQALVCALELHAGWRGARGSARGCVDVWLTRCVGQRSLRSEWRLQENRCMESTRGRRSFLDYTKRADKRFAAIKLTHASNLLHMCLYGQVTRSMKVESAT